MSAIMDDIYSEDNVFHTVAMQVLTECVEQTVNIRVPIPLTLSEGEFFVVINMRKMQSDVIERLTEKMSDDDACAYVRDKTNASLVKMLGDKCTLKPGKVRLGRQFQLFPLIGYVQSWKIPAGDVS